MADEIATPEELAVVEGLLDAWFAEQLAENPVVDAVEMVRRGGRVFGLLTLRSDFLGSLQNHTAMRGVAFASVPLGVPVETIVPGALLLSVSVTPSIAASTVLVALWTGNPAMLTIASWAACFISASLICQG